MILHFILLGVIFITLFFIGFFIGRGNGVKWSRNRLDLKNDAYLKELYKNCDSTAAIGLLIYFIVFLFLAFAGTYSDVRKKYIEEYDNGKYVWVQPKHFFHQDDSTTYVYKGKPYLKEQKQIKDNWDVNF